jgi:hypothetical protein
MATIKVNLPRAEDGYCRDAGELDSSRWSVFLVSCNLPASTESEKEYGPIPADYGYAEIKDVPAGRYLVFTMERPVNTHLALKDD